MANNNILGSIEDLLQAAIDNRRPPSSEYCFYLEGDLRQMGEQKKLLIQKSISVEQNDVRPVIKYTDAKIALEAIWQEKCNGWWHYKTPFITYKVATEQELKDATERLITNATPNILN